MSFLFLQDSGKTEGILCEILDFLQFHALNTYELLVEYLDKCPVKSRKLVYIYFTCYYFQRNFQRMFTSHNMYQVMCHLSCVTCRMSCVTCHKFLFADSFLFLQSDEA